MPLIIIIIIVASAFSSDPSREKTIESYSRPRASLSCQKGELVRPLVIVMQTPSRGLSLVVVHSGL
jgi:hypothetical protein